MTICPESSSFPVGPPSASSSADMVTTSSPSGRQENEYFKELAELLQDTLSRPDTLQGVNKPALMDLIKQLHQQAKDRSASYLFYCVSFAAFLINFCFRRECSPARRRVVEWSDFVSVPRWSDDSRSILRLSIFQYKSYFSMKSYHRFVNKLSFYKNKLQFLLCLYSTIMYLNHLQIIPNKFFLHSKRATYLYCGAIKLQNTR